MINTRIMYCRPGNLFKDFIVESNSPKVSNTGRVMQGHGGDGTKTLKGCLAAASDDERTNHSQKDHVVTHTIVQAGAPKARRTDRLVLGERVFYVVDVDDAGTLGILTIYYVEEREDVK